MKRIWIIPVVAILSIPTFTACREDIPFASEEAEGTLLSAYKEQMQTRATGGEEYFNIGTKYRIWMNLAGTNNPLNQEIENGVEGTEAVRGQGNTHYIDLGTYNERLSGNIDFYGFTEATETLVQERKVQSAYPIELQSSGDYIDYRRGQLLVSEHEETSGVLQMPFKHIMAQVRLETMKEETVDSELTLKSVEFVGSKESDTYSGVVTEGTYNVYNNTFADLTYETRTISLASSFTIPNTINGPKEIRTILLFPEAKKLPLYYLHVTFNDSKNFYGKGTQVTIDVPIYDNRVSEATPLHFAQNTSYTLCITFMSDQARIVTLVPTVYEWMDGETESKDEDGDGYQEQDLGQPVTFNGVMWSDRNLGATSAHPTRSIDDWYKSVGYFYQYGRNIPYFPNSLNEDNTINFNTPLEEALVTDGATQGKRNLYPVVNFASWGMTALSQTDKIKPVDGGVKCVWEQGSYNINNQYYWGFTYASGYETKYLEGYDHGWENNTNTPCPSGWRLPTVADFRGIVPGSGYAGNISFRKFSGVHGNGGWNTTPDNNEPDFKDIFSKEKIKDYVGVSGINIDVGEPIYQGFFPCIFREETNDPESGYTSKYVLSMMDEDGYRDWNRVNEISGELRGENNDYTYNWGVIYGIKKQGSASAYRMKWEVKLLSKNNPAWQEENNRWCYDTPFRGVLVISRYQASAEDDFVADTDGSYESSVKQFDWEHPVEVMYLPIGGFADNWSKGKLGNIGTELWYAISDRPTPYSTYKNIFWFKFAGSNAASQTMLISDKSLMSAAVQIRCVRDLSNK